MRSERRGEPRPTVAGRRQLGNEADPIAALRDEVRAGFRAVWAVLGRPEASADRYVPGVGAWISTGLAAAIYDCDKTWMRKLVVRHRLGEMRDGRWRVDPDAFAAFVADRKPSRVAELRRRLASASKRV